jgi:hypothetical protein
MDGKGEMVMANVAVETYPEDGEWTSRRQGSDRAFAVGGTKAEQVAKGHVQNIAQI